MNDIVIALAKASILVALHQPEDFDLESALKTYPVLEDNGAVRPHDACGRRERRLATGLATAGGRG